MASRLAVKTFQYRHTQNDVLLCKDLIEEIERDIMSSENIAPVISNEDALFCWSVQIGDPRIDQLLKESSLLAKTALIYGAAGAGKTLFSIQAAMNFLRATPSSHKVAFFTTDGAFPSKRLFQLEIFKNDALLLERFFIFEIRSSSELISFLDYFLPIWCDNGSLIIVDNLTSLIRFSLDLDEVSIDLPRAIHFARMRRKCKFILVSQIKAVIDDVLHSERSMPAIHPSFLLHGHIFDQTIGLLLEPSFVVHGERSRRIIVHPTLDLVASHLPEPLPLISYCIDEKKGIVSMDE